MAIRREESFFWFQSKVHWDFENSLVQVRGSKTENAGSKNSDSEIKIGRFYNRKLRFFPGAISGHKKGSGLCNSESANPK